MIGLCVSCGVFGVVENHHIIHGRGKRKQCEDIFNTVDLCIECHRGTYGVHGKNGHDLDVKLKTWLQTMYFSQGLTEDEVRLKMGGKLILVGEDIAGISKCAK